MRRFAAIALEQNGVSVSEPVSFWKPGDPARMNQAFPATFFQALEGDHPIVTHPRFAVYGGLPKIQHIMSVMVSGCLCARKPIHNVVS